MPTLIERGGRRRDEWLLLEGDAERAPAGAALLVPLAAWQSVVPALSARPGRLGILLAPSDDPAAIAGVLGRLELVAVEFPKFTDGRGYSIARSLRERHGWRGELRAVGEVLRDQLFYLSRCGFDSFALADGEDADAALESFDVFSDAYQSATDRGPLFLRRGAPAASPGEIPAAYGEAVTHAREGARA